MKTRPCPECGAWAASFDPHFRRWRCFACGWVPRSSVTVMREMRAHPRRGGPLPKGAIASAREFAVGAKYEFMAELSRGQWGRLAVRTFAGHLAIFGADDTVLGDIAAPAGDRLEFTHHESAPGCPSSWLLSEGPVVEFWDGGAKDGYLGSRSLLAPTSSSVVIVRMCDDGGARRRTDDNLRSVFG